MDRITENSRIINASREETYKAFLTPAALEVWQAPGEMTAKVHHFDLRVGGSYTMSLFYPEGQPKMKGKTTDREDRFTTRFVELLPNEKIVQAVRFDSPDPDYAEEMIMESTFASVEGGTKVTCIFKNIPSGIRPEDNEAGTNSSLEKLANYLEGPAAS